MDNLKKQILLGRLHGLKIEMQAEITDSDFLMDLSEASFEDLVYIVKNAGILDSDIKP